MKLPIIVNPTARVAVVGSRDFKNAELVRDTVKALPTSCTIVSGGARGVDNIAVMAARNAGMQTAVHLPDWSKGRRAGPERNAVIVNDSDLVIAFWDCESRGTASTISLAVKAGKPVVIIDESGNIVVKGR